MLSPTTCKTNSFKILLILTIVLLLQSCSEAIFDVKIESVPIDCFEIKDKNTDGAYYIKLKRYATLRDKLILYKVEESGKSKLELIKGDFYTHPLDEERDNKMREKGEFKIYFPGYSVFKTKNCVLFL